MRFGPIARSDGGRNLGHAGEETLTLGDLDRARGAEQFRRVCDHVEGCSCRDTPDGDHRGRERRGLAADDRLDRKDDLRRDHDRVDGGVGHAAVAAAALNGQREAVRASEDHAGFDRNSSSLQGCPEVDAEHPIHALGGAVGDHRHSPRRDLLGRLEAETQPTRPVVAQRRERTCGAERHRHVSVVAAGMHHAIVR